MDSECDRDSAEITFEAYMELCRADSEMGFHRNPETALKLFQSIQDIVKECLNKESLVHENNVTVGPSDLVYRRLESVSNFLIDMKHENILKIRSLRIVDDIRSIMEDLIERVKPLMLLYSDIVTGFKIATSEVYTFSHHVAYNRLGSILHIHLEILKKDITDLTCWEPTQSFNWDFSPTTVDIEPGQRVITLNNYELFSLPLGENPIYKYICIPLPICSKIEDVNWSFDESECNSSNIRSPFKYISNVDTTITQLLKFGKYFQREVSKNKIKPKNLHRVISMCNCMLIFGGKLLPTITFQNVRRLFNIVFSVITHVCLLCLKTVHFEETKESIADNLAFLLIESIPYQMKFVEQNNGSFANYIGIVFKFVGTTVLISTDYVSPSSNFRIYKKTLIIHRTFLPTEIGGRICNWDNKFSRYKTLEELVNNSETNSCCPVCQKPIDILKPETIAISENCDHLHCVPCLMKNVNESMESDSVRQMPKGFQCLHPSCKIFHYDFISGDLYDFFQNAVEAFVAAHGRIPLQSNWRIKEPCREHGPEYPEECAYWSKICEVDHLKE